MTAHGRLPTLGRVMSRPAPLTERFAGEPLVAWLAAAPLIATGATVTLTNWCFPSFLYGLFHRQRLIGAER